MQIVPTSLETLLLEAHSATEDFVLQKFVDAWKQGHGTLIIKTTQGDFKIVSDNKPIKSTLEEKIKRFFKP